VFYSTKASGFHWPTWLLCRWSALTNVLLSPYLSENLGLKTPSVNVAERGQKDAELEARARTEDEARALLEQRGAAPAAECGYGPIPSSRLSSASPPPLTMFNTLDEVQS
jgi:hypothetical protein